MNIELILTVLLAGIVTIASLTNILHLQVNEYLLFRYVSFVMEKGFLKAIFPLRISFPAKSIRNLLIFGFVFLLSLLYYYLILIFFTVDSLFVKVLFSILGYALSKDFVILGVLVTSPLSWLYRKRYMLVANRELKRSGVKIIGITGSYGKSSVKQYIHRILSTKYSTGKTRGNRNTEVGVAMEMSLQITPSLNYFIAEMGAYRKGDIAKLCKLYPPTIGIITGIGNQHLSLFGGRDTLIDTKLELLSGTLDRVYINGDWEGAKKIIEKKVKSNDIEIITYGYSDWVDIRAEILDKRDSSTMFKVLYKGKEEIYETVLQGSHSIVNILPAIAISRDEGIEYATVKDALINISPILGKLSRHTLDSGLEVINDSYNSNVDGFIRAIDLLSESPEKELYISNLGVYELGVEKRQSYEKIVKYLENKNITLLTTDSLFTSFGSKNVRLYGSENEILTYVNGLKSNNCILLLEGRHSPQFTKLLGIPKAY